MSDLFHEAVPDDYIVTVAQVMAAANWHTFQVLTKRTERMRKLLNSKLKFAAKLPHIWWGVSVENGRHGIPRIDDLRKADVAVRFMSIEPLLEDLGELDLSGIHWVIVGGESGPGARAMCKPWVEHIRRQCRAAQAPVLFQAMGRRAQEGSRSRVEWADVRRHAETTGIAITETSRAGGNRSEI